MVVLKLLLVWIVVEICFYAVYKWRVRKLGIVYGSIPQECPYPRKELMKKLLDTIKRLPGIDFETYVSRWFFSTAFDDIKRENIAEFIAWAFFSKFPSHLTQEEKQELSELIDIVQDITEVVFPAGHNPKAICIRLTLDPMQTLPRPFLLYVFSTAALLFTGFLLYIQGFRRFRATRGISYWHRPAPKCTSLVPPIIFFHGIGLGITPYLWFLYNACKGREAILVSLHFVSMRLGAANVPTPQEAVKTVEMILSRHRIDNACFVSHSFGGLFVAWTMKWAPHLIQSAVLIDPVCFLLYLPDVAYNFVYRKPTCMFEWIVYYFVSREYHIAHTLTRNFWWYCNTLWLEEIVKPTHVVLSGSDHILCSRFVHAYLQGTTCECVRIVEANGAYCPIHNNKLVSTTLFPQFYHAQFLVSSIAQKKILLTIDHLSKPN